MKLLKPNRHSNSTGSGVAVTKDISIIPTR
jgi:hypothetical protein